MINDNGFGIAICATDNGSSGTTSGRIDNISYHLLFDPLPCLFTCKFSAKKNNGSININWTTDDESGMSNYEVQRSSDGRNFPTSICTKQEQRKQQVILLQTANH
jgi:hypothetical protein